MEISQALISLERGDIAKWPGICLGKRERKTGKFVITVVLVSRESICNIILLPHKPLTVSLDIRIHEQLGIMPCCFNASHCLGRVVILLKEIGLLHPLFCGHAVGH
jgi:hypothetical protein